MFTSILRLLVLALELWVQRELRKEELQLDYDEKEWNRLRELGTPESTVVADRLRKRIVRSVGVVGKFYVVSTPDSSTAGGPASADKGRDSQTTG